MSVDLKGRHFVSMADFNREEIEQTLKVAETLKLERAMRKPHPLLAGRTLAMIFEKSSTRTRVSFETGMLQLGGNGLFLSSRDLQLGRGEPVSDSAQVLSRYVDGIMARTYKHETVTELSKYSRVPVINGLSDYEHPCQILADLLTLYEKRGKLEGLKISYFGDGNNVAHSLMLGAVLVGAHYAGAHPAGYMPEGKVVEQARELGKKTGAKVDITSDPHEAARKSDMIYTDVWTSMGQEGQEAERIKALGPYQVNARLMAEAPPHCVVMHCLPAHRGEEITADVIDGPQSVVFDEAENRLHAQKALLALTIR
ncbi:MAG TPA: ornithine carbamoyltransferase [Candidatus Xenobia bacterium]|jgi:ornithine carbamoyltransferase